MAHSARVLPATQPECSFSCYILHPVEWQSSSGNANFSCHSLQNICWDNGLPSPPVDHQFTSLEDYLTRRSSHRELVNIVVQGSYEEEEEEPAQAEIRPLILQFDEHCEPVLMIRTKLSLILHSFTTLI